MGKSTKDRRKTNMFNFGWGNKAGHSQIGTPMKPKFFTPSIALRCAQLFLLSINLEGAFLFTKYLVITALL